MKIYKENFLITFMENFTIKITMEYGKCKTFCISLLFIDKIQLLRRMQSNFITYVYGKLDEAMT